MTRGKAIDRFCRQCIYDPHCGGGTWKEQVAQCAAVSCPLWPYRPLPGGGQWSTAPTDPLSEAGKGWAKHVGEFWRARGGAPLPATEPPEEETSP